MPQAAIAGSGVDHIAPLDETAQVLAILAA
jgi:hypothetical protein